MVPTPIMPITPAEVDAQPSAADASGFELSVAIDAMPVDIAATDATTATFAAMDTPKVAVPITRPRTPKPIPTPA